MLTVTRTPEPVETTTIRTSPPRGERSMPWRIAFSTSGCTDRVGTGTAGSTAGTSHFTCRRGPKRSCSISR
ncbi:hypothetical protein [Pseudoxanthomonas taiwanensis]|uniref:hypothetical protein n=1 Tax=Pseudoxanthomonas taiwanensis TaxID=176598 RepID=UPI0021C3CF1D|nr:hypothetical protein [Pseudoxanthomonas taiwanensis]